jgi:hypothetical protein
LANVVAVATELHFGSLQMSRLFVPYTGRAIAQAVGRRLPTAAARVPAHVRSCRTCGAQNGTGSGFLRVLDFPLPILIPSITLHIHHL